MKDKEYEKVKELRGKGLSWKQIAGEKRARAVAKSFSTERLARGGPSLRKDAKRPGKPAVPEFNGDLLTEVKNSLKAEIERYEAALKALERLAS